MLLQISGKLSQPQTVTATELTSSHATRPIQTCQPLYLRAATTTNHRSRLSAHKQSPSQIFRSQQVHSSDAYSASTIAFACSCHGFLRLLLGTPKLQPWVST